MDDMYVMNYSGRHFDIICELTPFMVIKDVEKKDKRKICIVGLNKDNKYYFKKDVDNLLWVVYSILKEDREVNVINNGLYKEHESMEMIKKQSMEECKKDKGIKLKKIKLTCKNFINGIFSCKKLDMELLYGVCVYNELNIVMIKDKVAYLFGENEKKMDGVINIGENKSYYDKDESIGLDEYYVVENPIKPIKSASNYKVAELHEIAKKIGIETKMEGDKEKKKQIIYDEIKIKLVIE